FGGGAGGAANADFDSLIDLITSTVDVDSWMDNGTGQGDIQPFPTGVYVDAKGALRVERSGARATALASVSARQPAPPVGSDDESGKPVTDADAPDARTPSRLRFVSLPRLERAIAARQAQHEPLDPAMLTLAGLQRVEFVAVYPETGDLILAGPAGDWRSQRGALVSAETGQPVVRLDDWLTLLRRRAAEGATPFGCAIVPRQEALAATQEYLARTSSEPLKAGGRGQWLADLRDALGEQDVEFYHLESSTRVARLILAADYHMKLIGMGLAKGVPGVPSYLDTVRLGPDGQPPAMSVIRWWFSMPVSRVEASADGRVFALPEHCVEVLSENELLAARGERIHTGESDELTSGFARAFTEHFGDLAAKYQVYGELERVFELALAMAVIEQEGLLQQVDWQPEHLLNAERLRLPRVTTPSTVETVVNHRVIARRHVIAGVSGGVWIDPRKQAEMTAMAETDRAVQVTAGAQAAAANAAEPVWWWD
ncbi:MAG: DUF1598 domain-containing protein, partial [Planctomycetales bacterium]|nr:DUF1598 domain-containing protein [Planctomycetales bacterium]